MASGRARLSSFQPGDVKGKMVFSLIFNLYKLREKFWLLCWNRAYVQSGHRGQENVIIAHVTGPLALGQVCAWMGRWRRAGGRMVGRGNHLPHEGLNLPRGAAHLARGSICRVAPRTSVLFTSRVCDALLPFALSNSAFIVKL